MTQVRFRLEGAKPGEAVDLRNLEALRPSGNGEAPDGSKLVAGRITVEGMTPLALVPVDATSESGDVTTTTTDRDGYYFFYGRPRGERLTIQARFDQTTCHPLQGRQIEVAKNEAEIDIQTNVCTR